MKHTSEHFPQQCAQSIASVQVSSPQTSSNLEILRVASSLRCPKGCGLILCVTVVQSPRWNTLKRVETRWKDGGWGTMIAKIPPWTWLGTRFAICEVWLNDTRIVSTSAAMNIRGITWNKFRNKQMNSKWIANKLPRPHFLNASSRTELPAHAAKITNIITRMMDIAMAQH